MKTFIVRTGGGPGGLPEEVICVRIPYDGTEESILRIIDALPYREGKINWVRREGDKIVIPTPGAREVFPGEVVVVTEGKVYIEEE